MAKGDMGGAASAGQPQTPKMDQYSVMHRIMDNLGGQNNQGMAPSMNFNPSAASAPNSMINGGGIMGGRMNTQPINNSSPLNNPNNPPPYVPLGQYSRDIFNSIPNFGNQQPMGIVPNDPQQMIRRTMTGNNGLRMG